MLAQAFRRHSVWLRTPRRFALAQRRIVADVKGRLVPFEVKYSAQHTGLGDLKGIASFCREKKVPRGYVITRELSDFSVLALTDSPADTQLLKVPAALACYWLGQSELLGGRPESPEE